MKKTELLPVINLLFVFVMNSQVSFVNLTDETFDVELAACQVHSLQN